MARARNRRKKKKTLTPKQPLVKYGLISFNSIGYGNPTIENHLDMQKKGVCDDMLTEIYKKQFPANESDETLSELEYVRKKLKRLENKETLAECRAIDDNLGQYINNICTHLQIFGVYDLVVDLGEKALDTLVLKSKYHFNRARPYQLSFYYINQDELNPLKSCSATTPAYPSGHTLQALVVADILTHHFPEHKEVFDTIKRRVSMSRIIIGVHYPSDNEFSREIAEKVKDHLQIQDLYYKRSWEEIMSDVNKDVPE